MLEPINFAYDLGKLLCHLAKQKKKRYRSESEGGCICINAVIIKMTLRISKEKIGSRWSSVLLAVNNRWSQWQRLPEWGNGAADPEIRPLFYAENAYLSSRQWSRCTIFAVSTMITLTWIFVKRAKPLHVKQLSGCERQKATKAFIYPTIGDGFGRSSVLSVVENRCAVNCHISSSD